MAATTQIWKQSEMTRGALPHCHGGKGALDWTTVLADSKARGSHLLFVHDDVLAPGVSIGHHAHGDTEEYYYFLAGRGLMTLDDWSFEVGPGDITAVFPRGAHGLENTGDEDLRVVVICVAAAAAVPRAD